MTTAFDIVDVGAQVPELGRISDYSAYWAAHTPEAVAVTLDDGVGTSLNYREFYNQVARISRALLAAGIKHGDRVSVLSTPRAEAFASFLATARIGGIWVGINPRYTAPEIASVISDADPALLITLDGFEGKDFLSAVHEALGSASPQLVVIPTTGSAHPDEALRAEFLPWADFLATGESVTDQALDTATGRVKPDDPALIVYTSGSTGVPKGALLKHRGLVRLGLVEGKAFRVPDQPRYLCNAPLNHIGGLGDICGVAHVHGGSIVFRERFRPDELVTDLVNERISVLFSGPAILARLFSTPEFVEADLSAIKAVAWGGAAISLQTVAELRKLGVPLTTTYGSTEATVSVTYSDPDADDITLSTTVGRPDPELDVRLLGADGRWITEPGVPGEVCLKHPAIMAGYWQKPVETAEAFTEDGHFKMGDLGIWQPDGNLTLVGRVREMYKSGGYNIYPRELEEVIEAHPNVRLAAVVPRPDERYQEVGVGFVEPLPGARVTPKELDTWCRQRLANFKIPKEFRILEELPSLPNGKVDKQLLRERALHPSTSSAPGLDTTPHQFSSSERNHDDLATGKSGHC